MWTRLLSSERGDRIALHAGPHERPDRPQALVDWLDRRSGDLFQSLITATEVRDGIAKAVRAGATRKASALAAWWDHREARFADRLLPLDLQAATLAGTLTDRARTAGLSPGFADIAIAATAGRMDMRCSPAT